MRSKVMASHKGQVCSKQYFSYRARYIACNNEGTFIQSKERSVYKTIGYTMKVSKHLFSLRRDIHFI